MLEKNVRCHNGFIGLKLLLPIILGIAIIAVAGLELTNTTHFFHKQKATSGIIPSTSSSNTTKSAASSGSKTTSSSPPTTAATPTAPQGPEAQTPTSSSTGLIAPFGTFVSNHSPSLSGTSSPSQELSTCNTTPGASCYIEFTQQGVVKTLKSQVADSNGVVSWTWNVNQAGFTTGTWQITAVASLNGQTKDTSDQLNLQVQP
ncbi:MAG TPA: hypothetical protein VNE40_02130 [Candidatus Dormibacteraeota bacterium]|nr:hypothetical protein [Candidatus Dormibacteraeota bacterium]